ncbi:MAG: tRNA pseudouridine(38-40) synthase TruA [Hyphomicrobiaceae bacterium]
MVRFRIDIEYDGTPFVGWQVQANGPSVQGALSEAIFSFSGERVLPRGAGRTDAGVHALGQVAHFDLERDVAPDTVRDAINHHLKPNPVAVTACIPVASTFDARFSALSRRYLYRLRSRRARLVLDAERVWWVPVALDVAAMQEASKALLGTHDFTTFRAAACQAASPVKTLDRLDVVEVGGEIHVIAEARSFLHNQVRSIVGSLKLVGAGRWPVSGMTEALAARDRARCGALAPPWGLYLAAVSYPTDAQPPKGL